MDRNSMIGLGLIFAILVTFAWINQPSEAELKALQHQKDSLALVQQQDSLLAQKNKPTAVQSTTLTVDSLAAKQTYGSFAAASMGEAKEVTLENEELRLVVNTRGGAVTKVELKQQKKYDGTPVVLFDGANQLMNYTFKTREGKQINTSELFFTPSISADGKQLSMKLILGEGQYIEQSYALTENHHLIDYSLTFNGVQQLLAHATNAIELNWKSAVRQQEKNIEAEQRTTTVYWKGTTEEPDYISEAKEETKDITTPVKWISFKQQYFNASLIAKEAFTTAKLETKNDPTLQSVKFLNAAIQIPLKQAANGSFAMQLYYGENHYKTLAKLGIELERIVPMGWGIFRWVNKYLTVNVFYFLSQYIGSFGLIIFLLTLIVKTILFPLVYRSYLSTAKMRVLKPELDEIKEKFGDDMARIQQENMKIYRQAGVNPLGGCVPVLLQMPILVAMFQFLPSAFELRQQAFLWATDLSTYDSVLDFGFSIPGYGSHVSLFALLMTISSVVFAVYNSDQSGMTGQMKWMSYLMPVIFLFMLNSYASGLNYYYFVSNLFTIGQQLLIRGFVDDAKLHAQIQENKKKPVTKSKFQEKLEEMAKNANQAKAAKKK